MAVSVKAEQPNRSAETGGNGDRLARWHPLVWTLLSIALLLFIWYAAAIVADDPRRLPTPDRVLARLIEETALTETDTGNVLAQCRLLVTK